MSLKKLKLKSKVAFFAQRTELLFHELYKFNSQIQFKYTSRLLEIAVDVDKMFDMLRDMKEMLDRSYEFASKAPKMAHKKDGNVV